ncbi:MAG: oxidoreductase-like domain-containing protein [Candidatus Contendobacter sp.]|nr:oxidoreductase-like domain-containing protein [Candidatus Contendobacter sp.]
MPPEPVALHSQPIPPKPPIPGECCERGCENCVWVFYYEALRRYEAALSLVDAPLSSSR